MKVGQVIRTFSAKDKRKIVLRTPRWEDLDDFLKLINALVEERADILRNEEVTREEEIDFMARVLSHLEKGEMFYLVAEVDNHVVAVSEISRRSGYENHVGVIGIAIKNGYRDLGIGTEMMKTLEMQARKIGLKVLTLTAFATNKRAIRVYQKVGFMQTGVTPKKYFKDGKYADEIIMTKLLE
ncbi:GNAT family N-acetyltransferase [Candidatus Bathyarchaeota archaeon]|nr:GNAT family N-acetyltransferase [Candidatus Bathyarchaeota archaeon]